jgi:hypothetical protein
MSERTYIEKLINGVLLYTHHFNYGLIRRETSPEVGDSPFATILRFAGHQTELSILVDHDGKEWKVVAEIKDGLGNTQWEDKMTSSEDFAKVYKTVGMMLSKMPRNRGKALNLEDTFMDSYVQSTLYLVEREYIRNFNS